MAVTIIIAAILTLRTLLTLIVPADTAAEKSQAMVARKNQAMAAKSTRVSLGRAMVARSLLVMITTLIPLADTVVLKALNMVVSALSDLMALLAFLADSVEKKKSTARGGRSMAQVGMEAPADTATRVMGDDTKYDVPQAGYFMLMCCARSTLLTSP